MLQRYCKTSLVPRPPLFFVLRFAFSIIHGRGRARKTGKAWSHPSREWTWGGHREEGPNRKKQYTGSSVQALYSSSGLKTLTWSKLLVFTGKKLTLRVYSYIFEYRPLPLTSFLRPPRVYLTSHTWWMRPGLPCFWHSSASMYYTECKPMNKKRGRPGNKATAKPCIILPVHGFNYHQLAPAFYMASYAISTSLYVHHDYAYC